MSLQNQKVEAILSKMGTNAEILELLLDKEHAFDAGALYETLAEDLESYEDGAIGWSRGQVEFMYAYTEAFRAKHEVWRDIGADEPLTILEAVLALAPDPVVVIESLPAKVPAADSEWPLGTYWPSA